MFIFLFNFYLFIYLFTFSVINVCYGQLTHEQRYIKSCIFFKGPSNKTQNDDYCMTRGGYNFNGNLAVYGGNYQYYSTYISCWYGKFVKCMSCPQGLVFYEKVDWQGNYHQYGHCGYPRK